MSMIKYGKCMEGKMVERHEKDKMQERVERAMSLKLINWCTFKTSIKPSISSLK